jgi:hypothetical protein
MKITSDNLEVIAAKCYTNTSCLSTEEFLEDLYKYKIIKKLARKISRNNSKNLRLLTNHIICFTNNFEINFSKHLLLMDCDDSEKKVIRAVLLYLGFLKKTEYTNALLDLETIKMLKEMDR